MNSVASDVSNDGFEDNDESFFSQKDAESHNYCSPFINGTNSFYHYKDEYDTEQMLQFQTMNACMTSQLQVIREYFESHNVNNVLYTGWTPLLYAASTAQAEVVEYLLTNGADPNRHIDGYTPLMALCSFTQGKTDQCLKCLELLIKAKANPNSTSKQRETALMFACRVQEQEFVAELIKHVNNINMCDSLQKTALMYAVIANKPDVVKILLENEADTTIVDNNNLSAKDVAAMKEYTKILSLLDPDDETTCMPPEIFHINTWKDMFPSLSDRNEKTVDTDVSTILYGMGLEQYSALFQGKDLKTFLQLSAEDLCNLGMDISVHREQFMDHLYKFHRKQWNVKSIGIINKSTPYTIYDGVISLGTSAKHVSIIGSSLRYVENNLLTADEKTLPLTSEQASEYHQSLKELKTALGTLKQELLRIKILARKIKKQNDIGIPATYIGPKRNKLNWSVILTVTVIVGMSLSKTIYVQRL